MTDEDFAALAVRVDADLARLRRHPDPLGAAQEIAALPHAGSDLVAAVQRVAALVALVGRPIPPAPQRRRRRRGGRGR